MNVKCVIEIILAATIAFVPIGVLIDRFAGDRGIGARSIQFVAVGMLIPAIILLAMEQRIEPATLGTLIGGLIGYLLSGIGEYKPDAKGKAKDDETPPSR